LESGDFILQHTCATIVLLEDDPVDASFVELALTTARIRNRLHSFDSVASMRTFLSSTFSDERTVLFIVDYRVSGPESGLDFLRWPASAGEFDAVDPRVDVDRGPTDRRIVTSASALGPRHCFKNR
jgi:hypothetical protein